jgi:hypothetical protein
MADLGMWFREEHRIQAPVAGDKPPSGGRHKGIRPKDRIPKKNA